MDPSRLLATTRAGLERELLRSALTEAAPEEVRARVLQAVTEVLATSVLTAAAGNPAGASAATASSGMAGTTGAGAGSKLLAGLRPLQAACLGGIVAVGVSLGVALQPPAEHGLPRREQAAPDGRLQQGLKRNARAVPAAGAEAAMPAERSSLPEARADRATPGALANTELAPAQSSSSEIEPGTSTQAQAHDPANALDRAETSDGSDGEDLPADWLGAQLELLRAARAQLESGKLKEAAQLLDTYEQRFPGGVIGPQVVRLRAELRRQRWDPSAAP